MDQQSQEPTQAGPAPTVSAESDTEAFARWRADMRAYADGLLEQAAVFEEAATQTRARAGMARQIGADLHEVLNQMELPKRTPGVALHEALLEPPVNVFERLHPGVSL